MRIGILTFHSEINYGSVLQAYAMQKVLEGLGHEAVVIDKWENPDNRRLYGPLVNHSLSFWFKFIVRCLLLCGDWRSLVRSLKTMRFIQKNINRTPYHFYSWDKAPEHLGVDMITIGSDQVWNPTIVPPPDYLMLNYPFDVSAIAYSASIGMHSLAPEWLQTYRDGFAKLKAIGVREDEAKRLIEREGFKAEHVVDPTLLVDRRLAWKHLEKCQAKHRKLFCYFLAEDFDAMFPALPDFAHRNNADVYFFFDRPPTMAIPRSVSAFIARFKEIAKWHHNRVHGMMCASVPEFIREISSSTWVVTNSFHALMFSIVFRKNVRIVRPSNINRQDSSSRMDEFAGSVIKGPLVFDSLAGALASLERGEKVGFDEKLLSDKMDKSLQWLKDAIAKVELNSHEYKTGK